MPLTGISDSGDCRAVLTPGQDQSALGICVDNIALFLPHDLIRNRQFVLRRPTDKLFEQCDGSIVFDMSNQPLKQGSVRPQKHRLKCMVSSLGSEADRFRRFPSAKPGDGGNPGKLLAAPLPVLAQFDEL
jgi:hypothetical protein